MKTENEEYHWLTEQQFVDAVAVAMITRGPVVITVAFIGYLTAGLGGALVAAAGTFLPCYVLTFGCAPYVRKHGQRPWLKTFVRGITTAAVGAIAGAVFVLTQRTVCDLPQAMIAGVVLLARIKNLPELPLIGLCALAGVGLKLLLGS